MVAFNLANYAPGVYVFEQSTSAPIAGVGTSTAGFIGVVPDSFKVAVRNSNFDPSKSAGATEVEKTVAALTEKILAEKITLAATGTVIAAGTPLTADQVKLLKQPSLPEVLVEEEIDAKAATLNTLKTQKINETLEIKDGDTITTLKPGDILSSITTSAARDKLVAALGDRKLKVQVAKPLASTAEEDLVGKPLINPVTLPSPSPLVEYAAGTTITSAIATDIVSRYSGTTLKVEPSNLAYTAVVPANFTVAPVNEPKLCTNFGDFKAYFGDFSLDAGQNILAHAVYGFFRNGGTRCYVVRITTQDDIEPALKAFEAIDDIAIVAAPGITSEKALTAISDHCKQETTQDRVAIFDSPESVEDNQNRLDTTELVPGQGDMPSKSDYAAYYFPFSLD